MASKRARVTLAQVAECAGVSRSAACQALKGNPRISAATRERVKEAAASLGYSPDTRISEVMGYMRSGKRADLQPVIAYLHAFENNTQLTAQPYSELVFREAEKRANEHGFRLEPFALGDKDLRVGSVDRMLRTRGIEGVILSGDGAANEAWEKLALSFDAYAVCGITQRFEGLGIDHVGPDHYQGMTLLLDELDRRGYQRIGFVTRTHLQALTGNRWAGALAAYQTGIPQERRLPVAEVPDTFRVGRDFQPYLAEFHPDALVVPASSQIADLVRSGVDVPERVGVAALFVDARLPASGEIGRQWSGLNQNHRAIARRVVDEIVSKLLRRSRGLSESPAATMIEGFWDEGPVSSVRGQPAVPK